MDVIPWVAREQGRLCIHQGCMERTGQVMTDLPTAICVGFDPELRRRIARLLKGCGVRASFAPSLALIAGDEDVGEAGLLIVDTTTEGCVTPATAALAALKLAPAAKLVLVVSPWLSDEERIPEGIDTIVWPFDFGSYVDFFERIKAIGREVADSAGGV